jgi:hypothetical protein
LIEATTESISKTFRRFLEEERQKANLEPEIIAYPLSAEDWVDVQPESGLEHIPFGFRAPTWSEDKDGNVYAAVFFCPELIVGPLSIIPRYRADEYIFLWALHMIEHVKRGPFHGSEHVEAEIDKAVEGIYGADAMEWMSRIQMATLAWMT